MKILAIFICLSLITTSAYCVFGLISNLFGGISGGSKIVNGNVTVAPWSFVKPLLPQILPSANNNQNNNVQPPKSTPV